MASATPAADVSVASPPSRTQGGCEDATNDSEWPQVADAVMKPRAPLRIGLRSCRVSLPRLCENQEFRTKMITVIPLGFLCAEYRCIMVA